MNILSTPASFGINDTSSYYGGCMGNIGYSFFKSLSNQPVQIYATIQSHILSHQIPNIHFYDTGYDYKKLYNNYKLARQILSNHKIDLIFSPYFFYGVSFNPLFKAIKDHPFVIGMCETPHKRYSDEVDKVTGKFLTTVGRKLLYPLFIKTLDACDALIAVNEPAKDLYSKHIPRRKIKVIPYGVDMDKFKFTPLQENNHNILVVSRLIKRRRLDILIDAMPYILNEYPNAKLHIVGEGSEAKNFMTNYGILKRIFFYGNVSGEKLVDLYKNCYVYCSPSKEDGWNQPILEAMSSGRPVICADASHNSMVNNKTGFKLYYNDCIEYATTIKRLFGDFEIAKKMGEESRREVEANHNWNDIGKKYYEVFKGVI